MTSGLGGDGVRLIMAKQKLQENLRFERDGQEFRTQCLRAA
jgi:hypothetical protein